LSTFATVDATVFMHVKVRCRYAEK